MWSRPSRASAARTPPGTDQAGWIFLPPSSSMISWPNWRRRMPRRASSGSAAIRPKMFRPAGSLSMPRSRSGPLRWKNDSCVRLDDLAQVHQPAELVGGRRNGHGEDLVAGLGRGQQVADRADPADPGRDPGHLPERPPLAELLETAKLGHVEPGVGHLASVVELDRDLGVTLDPRHGVDHDLLCHGSRPLSFRVRRVDGYSQNRRLSRRNHLIRERLVSPSWARRPDLFSVILTLLRRIAHETIRTRPIVFSSNRQPRAHLPNRAGPGTGPADTSIQHYGCVAGGGHPGVTIHRTPHGRITRSRSWGRPRASGICAFDRHCRGTTGGGRPPRLPAGCASR